MVVILRVIIPISRMHLRCFFLLLATVSTLAALPTLEVALVTIGRLDLGALLPTTSTSAAAAVRTGILSAVSRNNKSLR